MRVLDPVGCCLSRGHWRDKRTDDQTRIDCVPSLYLKMSTNSARELLAFIDGENKKKEAIEVPDARNVLSLTFPWKIILFQTGA